VSQSVSHYQILERLGGGGMGLVHKAQELRLKRPVALEFLPPELTRDPDTKERFMQEAQAASALDHPHICTIHEIDETPDGQLFIVMAYYEGETLKKQIQRGPLKLDEALDIAIQVAQGLQEAHAAGIVHRDIKPANIMLTKGGLAKIVDFGLVKLLGQSGITRTGTTLGTQPYMSPEQTRGEPVDHRTDIWSLGVVLYEMASGQLPFKGDHPLAISNAILQAAPPPLSGLRSGVPLELERIVGRALAKAAADRHQTMADLVSELRRVKRESDSMLEAITSQSPGLPLRRPSKTWATVATAAAAGWCF
jgi:serine/threonine protein kinase